MNNAYKAQVKFLLDVLPEVAKEKCFAMHGGTAINLFIRNMPRLSVDIDLTYVKIAERAASLEAINVGLSSIKRRIEGFRSTIRVLHKENTCKLILREHETIIKIEVNMVGRGLIGDVKKTQLCESAQNEFNVFCVMPLVPMSQIYGGKLCAALDRQHPRDLFDVKLMLENEGFTNEIKRGFMFCLIGSNRPTHEILNPNLLDQRSVFENQFEGMSSNKFTYNDYESTRLNLIKIIKTSMDENDKEFLLSFNRLEPDWSVYNYENFPSVQWKVRNLEKFKKESIGRFNKQLCELESILSK